MSREIRVTLRSGPELAATVADLVLRVAGRAGALSALVGAVAIVTVGTTRTRAEAAGILTSIGTQLAELAADLHDYWPGRYTP